MRSVLMISYGWPPLGGAGVQRAVKLAKYLPSFGWSPVVLGARFVPQIRGASAVDRTVLSDVSSVEAYLLPSGYDVLRSLAGWAYREGPDSVSASVPRLNAIRRRDAAMKWLERFLLFPDSKALWLFPSLHWLRRIHGTRRIDAIWSSSGPETAHLVGIAAARKFRSPWVADFRDLWVDDPYQVFPTAFHRWLSSYTEGTIVRRADAVTVVGDEMGQILSLKYGMVDKVRVLRNGFDAEDLLKSHRNESETPSQRGPIRLVYMGTLYDQYQTPWESLMEGVARLQQTGRDVRVRVIGEADPVLKAWTLARYGDLATFAGYLPHGEALQLLLENDIAVMVLDRRDGIKMTVTGKVYELLASGLPILCIAPRVSEGVELVVKSGRGMACEPDEGADRVAELVIQILGIPRLPVEDSVQRFEQYSRRAQAQQLASILSGIS